MRQENKLRTPLMFVALVIAILATGTMAETLFVDIRKGDDSNPGTEEEPLRTIDQAATMVNSKTQPGPTTIKIAPGVYNLTKAVVFENTRPYTKEKRLTIEATILPDAPNWKPALMPVILSTEIPQKWEKTSTQLEASGLKVEISHVTICGLKFLGSPVSHIFYYPIFREGKNLEDLVITQCMFTMDSYALSSNVAIIANGHGLVVDHCVFYDCRNPVVFWNADGGASKNNAMRYCIVDGAYTSGVWVCQTAEDFEFHHNIITHSKYVWMRSSSNRRKYRLHNCIITDNESYSGECSSEWKLNPTRPELIYEEKDVIKTGKIVLEMGNGIDLPVPRNFLHPLAGTLGSDLGAGLFKKNAKKNNLKDGRGKMNVKRMLNSRLISVVLIVITLVPSVAAETVCVDSRNGGDSNPGTEEKPVWTIGRAAAIINDSNEAGPTTIKIALGVYNLTKAVIFENTRPYTKEKWLTIEATILPDAPNWKPALMPIILSAENSQISEMMQGITETYSIKIKISHVTIRGLRFLGNPASKNWHNCIERVGEKLDDLLITQCMFIGDKDTLDIYSAVLGTGNRFIVDHCIFKNCHACVVLWDGFDGVPGKNCVMRYCIVDGAYISGVWTCQTAEDFEFHHNIITNGEYFWIRKAGDLQRYRLQDCIVSNNKYYSRYGTAAGATDQTGQEVTYDERNIIKEGNVTFVKDRTSRNYLHVKPVTFGSNLGAGLFKEKYK